MFSFKTLIEKYPKSPRYLAWGGGSLLLSLGVLAFLNFIDPPSPPHDPNFFSHKSSVPKVSTPRVSTPGNTISSKELWVNRIEGKAQDMHQEVEEIRRENQAMKNQIDLMTGIVETLASSNFLNNQKKQKEESQFPENTPPLSQEALLNAEDSLAGFPLDRSARTPLEGHSLKGHPLLKNEIKIISIEESPLSKEKPKTVEEIIPAGTYAAGILTSGIAANTSLNSQSDPGPAIVRLTTKGFLPRGFKADISDAVVIAACYGDISSERAQCRLTTLMLVERNGEILTRKVQGWLIGDDGIPGIKGKVVDRAGEVVRGAFWAGLLSGISNYFKSLSQEPLYTVTGVGTVETKKQPESASLKSAGASGASSALEKIADFALKRAEQMQPVIMINPGRHVDVVFKEDVDLSNSSVRQKLVLSNEAKRDYHAQQEAINRGIQLEGDQA